MCARRARKKKRRLGVKRKERFSYRLGRKHTKVSGTCISSISVPRCVHWGQRHGADTCRQGPVTCASSPHTLARVCEEFGFGIEIVLLEYHKCKHTFHPIMLSDGDDILIKTDLRPMRDKRRREIRRGMEVCHALHLRGKADPCSLPIGMSIMA